jgi:tetratricopeptide (TPR) repeat protein
LNKRSVDPEIAALLLQVLGKELSDDPVGQDILTRFKKAPKTNVQELTDYLEHRLDDTEFREKLSAAQELPDEMRTIISGGHIERLIQIASANTVNINPGIPLPVGLAAVVIGVISLTILLISILPPGTPPMSKNGFNVAVAEFAMIDSNGKETSSDISRQFSDGLFTTIENETNQLPAALQVELRGPKDVGIVGNDDSAREIAQDLEATILIYGRVERDDQGFYQVEPRFFVKDQTTFSYGSEVTGPEYLGQPVTGLTLGPDQEFEFNLKLNARSQALGDLFRGLAYFSIHDYKSAAVEFQDAVDIPHWERHEGQEVAYLLLGAAHLRGWDLIQNPGVLAAAADAFNQAYDINPGYVRNYLSLGAVAVAQAQIPNESRTGIGKVDKAKLVEGINWYSAGLDQTQPPQAYIPTKAAFGLGQAYLLGYEFHVIDGSKELSRKYFQQVIDEYQAEKVSDLAWFAAHAHAGLGRLAGLDSNWPTMSDEYRLAIAILKDMQSGKPPLSDPLNLWIARFWSYAGFAEVKRNDWKQAQDYYSRAIAIGTETVSKKELVKWQNVLDGIKNKEP